MESATDELIELIKEHGRWQDPPVEEGEGEGEAALAAAGAAA